MKRLVATLLLLFPLVTGFKLLDDTHDWTTGGTLGEIGGSKTFTTPILGPLAFASLVPESNGTMHYCTDCLSGTNPCTGGGTGSIAERINGAWVCRVAYPAGFDTWVQYNDSGNFGASADFTFDDASALLTVGGSGNGYLELTGGALAALGTPVDGTLAYCSDCAPGSSPCTASSTGSYAERLNGAWVCKGSGAGGGVTSVGLTMPGSIFAVGGSPVTTSGTLAVSVAGNSGGIPYFSSGTALGTTATLATDTFVIGKGAGAAPVVTTGLTYDLTNRAVVHAPTLGSGITGYTMTGTFNSGGGQGVFTDMTTAGSSPDVAFTGTMAFLRAGYAAAGYSVAGFFESLVANTGTDLRLTAGDGQPKSDIGTLGIATRTGTGTGYKTGGYFSAYGSTGQNTGVIGKAAGVHDGAHIGVLGIADGYTGGANYKDVGGMFIAGSAIATGVNVRAAIVADGGAVPGDFMFYGQASGARKFTIDTNAGITIDTGGGLQTAPAGTVTRNVGACTLVFTSGILTGGTCTP